VNKYSVATPNINKIKQTNIDKNLRNFVLK